MHGRKGKDGEDLRVIKAFFIPISDLQEVLELAKNDSEKNVAGMRIYFRLENEEDDLNNLQAMVVPVIYDADFLSLKDWTQLRHSAADEESSLVFDFTKPCPTECDSSSPLAQ